MDHVAIDMGSRWDGMDFGFSAFFPILRVHILAGLVCVVTEILTLGCEKRAGLHPICGTIYHWGLAALVISAAFLAAAHWANDRVLLAVGAISFGASSMGRMARRRHWKAWVSTHITCMGGSFIAMLTAFLVEEGKSLPGLSGLPRLTYWFVPALVAAPLIIRALVCHHLFELLSNQQEVPDAEVAGYAERS